MDFLFDGGYITFDEEGNVASSSKLDLEVAEYVKHLNQIPSSIILEGNSIYTITGTMYF